MASGYIDTGALADSLPTIRASARLVREFMGVMVRLSDRTNLAANSGLTWHEISLSQLTASSVNESTVLDNPQQLSDSLISITPTMVGIHVLVTDRVLRRIQTIVASKLGSAAQTALQRKKDEDGLAFLDTATTQLGAAGATLQSGIIGAAKSRITSNATEPGMPPIYGVFHGFQIKDIQDELAAGVGTYPVQGGLTESVFRNGFSGSVYGVELYEAGNLTIDSSDDAKGAVFAREAVVLVDGMGPKSYTRARPEVGGGANEMFHYDEYAWGERGAGLWMFEIMSDATAPSN